MLSKNFISKSVDSNSRVYVRILDQCAHMRQSLKSSAIHLNTKCLVHLPMISYFLISTHQASALVDDRLAGEGTGKALGINNPILGYVILAVFTTIWSFYFTACKDLGGERDEDGLGL